ncbi:hypothetical protein T439DRAFT_352216 [Meredithblackwellia eburnea MCA 4105]
MCMALFQAFLNRSIEEVLLTDVRDLLTNHGGCQGDYHLHINAPGGGNSRNWDIGNDVLSGREIRCDLADVPTIASGRYVVGTNGNHIQVRYAYSRALEEGDERPKKHNTLYCFWSQAPLNLTKRKTIQIDIIFTGPRRALKNTLLPDHLRSSQSLALGKTVPAARSAGHLVQVFKTGGF